jgi:hypothetical protein
MSIAFEEVVVETSGKVNGDDEDVDVDNEFAFVVDGDENDDGGVLVVVVAIIVIGADVLVVVVIVVVHCCR